MASEYAGARPPYPPVVFDTLREAGVTGPGLRVLEVGAGAGLATRELVRAGCDVTAVEPGPRLAALLGEAVTGIEVLTARVEDAPLPDQYFDSVVAATAMHWVDLPVALPRLRAALRPRGRLAVVRTIFGDDEVRTEFRTRVAAIVSQRPHRGDGTSRELE